MGDAERDWHFLAGVALESEAEPELQHSNSSHVLGRGVGRIGEFWEAAAFTLAGKSSGSCVYLGPSEKVSLFCALSKGIPGRW